MQTSRGYVQSAGRKVGFNNVRRHHDLATRQPVGAQAAPFADELRKSIDVGAQSSTRTDKIIIAADRQTKLSRHRDNEFQ